MIVLDTVAAMRAYADAARREGKRIGLAPTMGALHAGHLALVAEAARRADLVVATIFVNPTQFGPGEDYARYPRTLAADVQALEAAGADAVFTPSVAEMYGDASGASLTWVTVEGLGEHLCGAVRPGHFRGVTTIVAKLFLAAQPHVAVFGLKDAQQFFILRRMTRDLLFGIEIVGAPTVREPDGLALSSRNAYLRAEHRAQAPVLHAALLRARRLIEEGEQRPQVIVETVLETLHTAPDARVQYVEVVDTEALKPVHALAPGQEALVALAVFFGDTRLIDNVIVRAPGAPAR